jgi:preprotein translocase subunit SecA
MYKSFLGDYLNPEADLKVLSQQIIKTCKALKPVSCDDGFGDATQKALPTILAGIFAVFTIIKSGESFARLGGDTNASTIDATKLLMKPHNIQVLTLLCMFGCDTSKSTSLESRLMQIRTGEGKSMILGAAAATFGLLGFRVRCVCYSEYLSNRDYELFRDVFDLFGLLPLIRYSKITTLSEDKTAAKGNIRGLTLSLLYGTLPNSRDVSRSHEIQSEDSDVVLGKRKKECSEEIMLVDEVDVFFGSEFYGRK